MRKVITPGKKEFIKTCTRCGCKFSYELEDLGDWPSLSKDWVRCPDCNESLPHNIYNDGKSVDFIYQNLPYSIPCVLGDCNHLDMNTVSSISESVTTLHSDNFDDIAYWELEADGFHCSKCHYKAESTQLPYYCPNCNALMNMRNHKSGALLDNDNFPIE